MTLRPTFVEHPAVELFGPYLAAYVAKGLQEVSNRANGGKIGATAAESYAARVFERIGELDNSIKSLRMALGFVLDLDQGQSEAIEVYRYHYENFLLRLTGIVDRAHRLVGTSLCLDPAKLDKIGSNQFVASALVPDHKDVQSALRKLSDVVSAHKTTRNAVAHSEAFTSRELGLFAAVNALKLELGEIQIGDLMDDYFSKGGAGLASLIAEVVTDIEALLDVLAPVYQLILDGNQLESNA